MESIDTLKSTQPAQPLPDISTWTNQFTEWGIWPDIAGSDNQVSIGSGEPGPGLGLLLAEARVATGRIFAWTAVLVVLGLVFGGITFAARSSLPIFGVGAFFVLLSMAFIGAAVYRVAIWFLNRDMRVRVFREGFSLDGNGETRVVRWRDISGVREKWRKAVIQAVIHINIHNLTIFLKNGQKIELDRTLGQLEEISALIQAGAADFMLPAAVEYLKDDKACEFGAFKISRYGIAQGQKKVLPWSGVKSLNIGKMGQTTLTFYNMKAGSWATAAGDSIPNLQLFIMLAAWFIDAAARPVQDASLTTPDQKQYNGDVNYGLLISRQEAKLGTQKKLYVGPANHEQRLVVTIPAGVVSETVYPFPGYGRPAFQGGAGTLNVVILVPKGQENWQIFQMMTGLIMLMFGMMWLGFWSSFDLISSTVLAALIGGFGGTLMGVGHRRAGAISGIIGAIICFFVQVFYYAFMYMAFARESFWNYETVFVMFIGALPGFGLYWLLVRTGKPKPASSSS